jgi:hypothetical protein
MSPPVSNQPDRWRRWRWVTPALVIILGIMNVMNSRLDRGLRMAWAFVLLPSAVIALGYVLYAHLRERRHGKP